MRFEDRPDEQKFKDAYRALGELRIALRAIAYRQPDDHDRAALDWIVESHLGVIEQLVKSEHMAYLRTAPLPRLLITGEPNTITLEEAHRRLRELGHDPANYNGVLIVPADVPMVDFGDRPEEKSAAADLATIIYELGQRVTEDIYERLRHELEPEAELPDDPTGVDCHERHESPEDQA